MNTAQLPITDYGKGFQFAHGLGAMPTFIRAVLLCTTDDLPDGVTAGTEIGLESVFDTDTAAGSIGVAADATFIYLSFPFPFAGTAGLNWKGVASNVDAVGKYSFKVFYQ